MDSAAPKRYGGSKDLHKQDRISNLPSCLMGHILSLLSTKEAVATSVLSKRWEKHWTLVTRLKFDDFEFRAADESTIGASCEKRFTNSVYRVLQCKSLQISKFCIKCYGNYNASNVIAWITMVLRSSIQELHIYVNMRKPVTNPWNLFTCETLVKLKLADAFVIDVPTSVNLPCLKVLCLYHVKLIDEDSISRLLGGCPVLEELTMRKCIDKKVKAIKIFAPALTSLDLTHLGYYGTDTVALRIVLKTPMLSCLVISDFLAQGYELKDLHYLSQAKINVYIDREENQEDVDEGQRQLFNGLLEAISKVNSLEFGSYFMEDILLFKFQVPEFQNVTELKLDYCDMKVTAKMLPMLLTKMPNLTTLTIDKAARLSGEKSPKIWAPLEGVLRLKKTEMRNFEWSAYERKLVEYFLKNAKLLEKLIIHYDISKVDIIEIPRISNIILQIPKSSRICKVEFIQESHTHNFTDSEGDSQGL